MGQAHTVMAMDHLALPDWGDPQTGEQVEWWLRTLGEHDTVIRRLTESHSDEFALLKQYRRGFTQPVEDGVSPGTGQRAELDDFGPRASFSAMNSFAPPQMRRGIDRIFVETAIPLAVHNSGPGFVHYSVPEGGDSLC
jgi:hypothetical protein